MFKYEVLLTKERKTYAKNSTNTTDSISMHNNDTTNTGVSKLPETGNNNN